MLIVIKLILIKFDFNKQIGFQVIAHNPPVNQLYTGPGYPGALAHPHYPHPVSDMYGWPRPAHYPYPYGAPYLPNSYQPPNNSFQGGIHNNTQGTNYFPSLQSRLQAMTNFNTYKDNPQVRFFFFN